MSFRTPLLATLASVALLSASPVFAEQINFSATLTGTAETPPNDATGTGTLSATLDTDAKTLTWAITYDGLTGPATAAHFHGPAAEGEKAPPVVPIEGELTSPIDGSVTLSDAQEADLEAGLWYFNVHTAQYPDGELRGQVMQAGTGMSSEMSSSEMSSSEMSSSEMSSMASDTTSSMMSDASSAMPDASASADVSASADTSASVGTDGASAAGSVGADANGTVSVSTP